MYASWPYTAPAKSPCGFSNQFFHFLAIMAKSFHCSLSFFLPMLILFLSIEHSSQLQPSQYQTLLKIQQLLGYPSVLSSFGNSSDFCHIESSSSLTIVCFEDDITQLHIIGNNVVPQLPQSFSTHVFFSTLLGLPSLKVLSLVALGLWGPLPSSFGRFSSLEILNVSKNYINGDIPEELSTLSNLQTLVLDHNNFTGVVPSWLSHLQSLAVLSLRNNSLKGPLPDSISSLRNLRILVLSGNGFSGEVPSLCNLTNLQELDLEDNYFGPHFPCLSKRLISLVLRNNSFRSGIPLELGSFKQLQKFDISLNGFMGPFLPFVLSLPMISYLDIAGNKFTGKLSENITCNPELTFVNLSSNLLTGELPNCLQIKSKRRVVVYSGNCLSNGDQEQHPYPLCRNEALAVIISPRNRKQKRSISHAVIVLSIVGAVVGGAPIVVFIFLVSRKLYTKRAVKAPPTRFIVEKSLTANTAKLLSDANHILQTMKIGGLTPAYRTFFLEELKEATNNFDESSRMGNCPDGQMYKGELADGTLLAIRSFKIGKRQSPSVYMHQLEMISKLRHTNLVSALGHCIESHTDDSGIRRIFLVFEFVSNGTLRNCISGEAEQKMSWSQRIAAAIEITKGVQFLQTGIVPGIFVNNLKITNVLLDHDFHVKLIRYDLPLLETNTRMVEPKTGGTAVASSGPIKGRANYKDKDEVYDLGVILLEIVAGRPVVSQNEVITFKDTLQASTKVDCTYQESIVDPAVLKDCSNESLKVVMEICLRCLSNEPAGRPSVDDVLWNLQFAAQVQESWKREFQVLNESNV